MKVKQLFNRIKEIVLVLSLNILPPYFVSSLIAMNSSYAEWDTLVRTVFVVGVLIIGYRLARMVLKNKGVKIDEQ